MVRNSMRAMLAVVAVSAALSLACTKDPYDPQTWIDKLEDPGEVEAAITELERLKCPEAIKPLGKIWEKHNKWSKVLRVIIALADQPNMKEGAVNDRGEKIFPNRDCPDAGEGPYWDDAMPVLIKAVEEFDVSDDREIQDAAVAADALGRAKNPDAIQTLISAATKKEKLRQGQMVRIAAIKALGGFGDNPRTVETIVKILEEEATMETIRLNAAAANALADTKSEKAIVPLLKALYEVSPIYQQVRTAITTLGEPTIPELIKIFEGKHAEINKLADANNFAKDCDKGEGPGTTCIAPGNLRFKAASLLGDLRAQGAVKSLLAALKKPESVSFFDPKTGAPGPADHNAILDALRNIGATSAADELREYMMAESTSDLTRPLAIDVYSMLARDTKALDYLAKLINDPDAEQPIRSAAALAYARLVQKKEELAPLEKIIELNNKKAAEADAKAAKAKNEDEKAEHEGTANDYRTFAREYEQHRTRARVGIECGNKVDCYKEFLTLDAQAIVDKLKIPNHRREAKEPMKKQDTQTFRIAAIERALLDIAKMGDKGAPAFETLLTHADSTDRIIRQGVLLAMVQVAPKPCDKCLARLDEIITAQEAQTTLDYLTADTRIVRNYFAWAGRGGDAKK